MADPALSALSTQLPIPTTHTAAEEQEELAHGSVTGPRAKRVSNAAMSINSDYTSGAEDHFTDAEGGYTSGSVASSSQATISRLPRSETGHDDSFVDAESMRDVGSVAGSRQDLSLFANSGMGRGDPDATQVLPVQHGSSGAVVGSSNSHDKEVLDEKTPQIQPSSTFSPLTASSANTTPALTATTTFPPKPSAPAFTEKAASSDEKTGGSGGSGGKTPPEDELEDPDLAHLTETQRKVVLAQVHEEKRPQVGFTELFRFTSKFELACNAVGILAAIIAGSAQPLMTVVFGALTTAFVAYGSAQIAAVQSPGPASEAALATAKAKLFDNVNHDVLLLVAIGAGMFGATYLYSASFIYTGETATRRIREKYLRAVLRQNVAYFDKQGAGEVTTRIQTDTHLIQEGISDKIPITVMFMATFFTGFIVAYVRNWRLALVISTIIPAIGGAGAMMNKYISAYKAQILIQTGEGGTLAEEVISSVRNTHAFGTQHKLADLYDVKNKLALDLGIKAAYFNACGMGVFFFVIYNAYALAFYYGTTLLLQHRAVAGEVVNVFLSILIAAFSLAQIAPNLQAIAFARGAATSIYSTIDRVPVIDSASPDGLKPEKIEGVITFEKCDFIYPSRPSVQVLFDFNAVFPKGKMTALVGASGSGKSTCIGLIERFYDPVGGLVKLDGVELSKLNVKWLRTQIGLVSQEPTLFATTVAGNIAHGLIGTKFEHEDEAKKRDRIITAARTANADGFISNLPEGYDTMIGERGMLLSGGQKQRIAIARAIVGDPQILLLDEATSALDTASETIVQDALDRASAGRTTVTIAHRLSTIKDADQIIVMTAGKILESAMSTAEETAHLSLLKNPDGAYTRLVFAQKFKEDSSSTEVDSDSDDGTPVDEVPPEGLSSEQIAELAKNEKPQFQTLKRAGTGRSAASEAIEQKHQRDLETGLLTPKHYSYTTLFRRMLGLNWDKKWLYAEGLVASIVAGCVYPVFGIIFGGAISTFSLTGSALRSGGDRYALYCFIIAIVATCSIVAQNHAFGISAENLSRKIRLQVFKAILRQDIAFFDKDENSTGHLTSAISDYAQKVYGLMGITLGVIIQSIFTLVVGAIIGLSYGWKTALVGIACFPLTIAAGVVRLRIIVLKDARNKKAHEQSAQMACEAAGAIRTVASLTREDDCCEIYSQYLEAPQRESNRTALISNIWFALSQALTFFVIGLIFWFGSHQLVSGALSTRGFFITMISIVFGSIQAGNVFAFVPDMSSAHGAAISVCTLLDSEPEIDAEDPSGDKFETCDGLIRFDNVHYRYITRPHVPVLRGLTLEVRPGEFVAIVGPSGCGKSTLIQLVERFYDPLSGRVSVDGHDISELNLQSYRQQISLVSQEPTLYAGSVKFNVTLGANVPADQVTQAQIEQACKDANIHDFVMSLPDGYETDVGGKGTQLSGGQKQRLAIARALIRNPKILLLDEATSALDSESEKVVQKALDQAAEGRTTIAVAHRLSTIQNADQIFVLKDGKVAEKGKHFELLAKKGIYAELVQQQDLEKRR